MSLLSGAIAAAAAGPAGEAWRWWSAELRNMLPDRLPTLGKDKSWSDIYLARDSIVIDRVSKGSGERLAEERPIEGLDADGWAELAGLIEGTPSRLILSPPDVFATEIVLPAAAMRSLKSAVELQLGQVAPLEPESLIWKSKIVARDKSRLTVLVVMARAERVAQIQKLFWERGISAPPIFANISDRAIELAERFDAAGTGSRSERGPALIAAALIASIPFTTWAGARILTALTEYRIAAVRSELAPRLAADARARNDEAVRQALKAVLAPTSALAAIENLALGMPDNAYATELSRDAAGIVHFTVETTDTEALAQTMSEAPLFSKASAEEMNPGDSGRMRVNYRSGGT